MIARTLHMADAGCTVQDDGEDVPETLFPYIRLIFLLLSLAFFFSSDRAPCNGITLNSNQIILHLYTPYLHNSTTDTAAQGWRKQLTID